MAAEIVQINTQDFTSQTYGGQDTGLISSFEVNTSLSSSSYIEYFVYDNNQNLLSVDYNFNQYTVQNNGQSAGNNGDISEIIIDPEKALIDSGFDQGEYITYFNFFNKQIGSEFQQLYITEISSDRTEIRLDSTSLTDVDIVEQTTNFIQLRNDSPYFLDFYLNFGDNQLPIANNIQLDNQDPKNPTILIKLYEALPEGFDVNSTLWIVTLVEDPIAYQVTFEDTPIIILDTVPVKGPNFNLDIKDQVNNSTVSSNYTSLTTTTLTSSFNQLSSLLEEKEIDINIDYTDFNNFIHFSSVQSRLENFYYKMSLLEDYSSSISLINTQITGPTSASSAISGSVAVYESQINNIITNFDGYEYYLYYTSGSYAWPKTTSQPPYSLAKTGSNAVLTWFGSATEGNPYYGGIILSASQFDNLNQNNLYYTIPEYLREDPTNEPYQLFIEMVGQFYDNIWIYYKDVTEKYNADNRLENGVSKDIVADAIRDFGIKLYQNNFSNEDLYTAFLGLTPGGNLFPFPNITGSLPTPSGFEYVDTLISASNDYMPLDDVNKSLYKRIYHNLPYLLKAKGTLPGLRALITSYGIPDTILRINEYGGKDKSNTNDWDYWQNTFNYYCGGTEIITDWELNHDWNSPDNVPATLEFRFKIKDLLLLSGSSPQLLWKNGGSSLIELNYTGSGYNTHPPTPNNPLGLPYSGSIIDPYYQYAHLNLYPDAANFPNLSASVYLPFCDEDWWSVMVTRDHNNFILYAGNKEYEGGDNNTVLGFYDSSSINVNSNAWTNPDTSIFIPAFEGYLQEVRYYNTVISESVFKDYIMNPHSIEGNTLNSSPDNLAFRASLGGELYTGSVSIHPKVTGSWVTTSSFTSNSNFTFSQTPVFAPNEEYFFYDQVAAGIRNAVSDKIRLENSVIPSGDTLSPFRSLAQNVAISQSYTANTNLLEVAFSPQDEINEDIMDQIGYFNIGELIGDPRQRSSSATSYPALDNLRNAYFEKYTKNYDLNDFIRLIKFFDNSLFKMIKDFVPARTSLASGVVIKQTLLERNKYPQPQVNTYSNIANIGVTNSSSAFLIPGDATVNVSISYPITASGVTSLSITGSITEDAIDSTYYIRLYNPSAVLLATLDSFTIAAPFNTSTFSGSYVGVIPQGSYIYFSADPGAGSYQINNFTASLQLLIPSYTPYTTQNILVSGTVAPQWNDYQEGTVEHFDGGAGGVFNTFNTVTNTSQSWYETIPTISGSVIMLHNSQDEFYDGEFSGSTLIVTTQSLSQPYPLENISFDYTPVRYSEGDYGFLNDLSDDPNPPTAQNQFLNSLTVPNQGEILLLTPWFQLGGMTPGGGFIPNQRGPAYVKMHKFDNNGVDNTIPLGQATQILIQYSTIANYYTLNVLTVNEYPTYYLYQVNNLGSDTADNYIKDYNVSASFTSSIFQFASLSETTLFPYQPSPVNTNIFNQFNTSSGIYTSPGTPNIRLSITASLTTSGSALSLWTLLSNGVPLLDGNSPGSSVILQPAGSNVTMTLSGSFLALNGENIQLVGYRDGSGFSQIVKSGSFLITQSIAPSAKENDSIIIEPYITLPNYYNSDYNPLINNTEGERLSTKFQDVDYSTGIATPTNFKLLISGSAVKAAVQDSNYSSKRVILPRYEGSKTTSQHLNYWTPGDSGTYGKLPSVENLKTAVAYCDWIGGWPPDRMNASAIHVLYLIKADGTVVIPNTSQNSLTDIKGNFESGENIFITAKTVSAGQPQQARKIIRGGTRIEPILYNQSGSMPGGSFLNTITLTDNGVAGGVVSDFQAKFRSTTFTLNPVTTTFTEVVFNQILSTGSAASATLSGGSYRYVIDSGMISEGVSLTFSAELSLTDTTISSGQTVAYAQIVRWRGGNKTVISNIVQTTTMVGTNTPLNVSVFVPFNNLVLNDEYAIETSCFLSNSDIYINYNSYFIVNQSPSPNSAISIISNFWISSSGLVTTLIKSQTSGAFGDNLLITSCSSALINYYGSPSVYQEDIAGSGFNPIVTPWSIQYGDEFRFEGREDRLYQVKQATVVNLQIFSSQIPLLVVEMNQPLATSGSVNFNQFEIRRYVDDASQIIMEGFRPADSSGPYIVRPEFVVPELNKSVDQFILDLTQKGLIT
jgi:hypothetical protein